MSCSSIAKEISLRMQPRCYAGFQDGAYYARKIHIYELYGSEDGLLSRLVERKVFEETKAEAKAIKARGDALKDNPGLVALTQANGGTVACRPPCYRTVRCR